MLFVHHYVVLKILQQLRDILSLIIIDINLKFLYLDLHGTCFLGCTSSRCRFWSPRFGNRCSWWRFACWRPCCTRPDWIWFSGSSGNTWPPLSRYRSRRPAWPLCPSVPPESAGSCRPPQTLTRPSQRWCQTSTVHILLWYNSTSSQNTNTDWFGLK